MTFEQIRAEDVSAMVFRTPKPNKGLFCFRSLRMPRVTITCAHGGRYYLPVTNEHGEQSRVLVFCFVLFFSFFFLFLNRARELFTVDDPDSVV